MEDVEVTVAGAYDAGRVREAYLRHGVDGFLRVFGPYSATIRDRAAGRTIIAVLPGSPVPLFVAREKGNAAVSSSLFDLARGREPDREAIDAWVASGLWAQKERTLFAGVEAIAPGSAMIIETNGRARRRLFYAYSPFLVPRSLSKSEAELEISRALARVLAARVEGERVIVAGRDPHRAMLLRHLPRTIDIKIVDLYRGTVATEAARRTCGPVSLKHLEEAAALAELSRDAPVISDLGARELFGETARGNRAFRLALARAFEATPRPSTAVAAARAHLWPELYSASKRVLRRWARRPDGAVEPASEVAEVTGNAFVDHRFAEVTDVSMSARARAAGERVIAPFLEPEMIETVFSLPPEHFAPPRAADEDDDREDRRRGIEALLREL